MSRVMLIAADKPLPLCDKKTERTRTISLSKKTFTITTMGGFSVSEHSYYRQAVEMLGLPMKSYRYELDIETEEEDLADFKTYIEEHLASGEEIELWNLWVGEEPGPLTYLHGEWKDFDLETLKQFDHPFGYINAPGQCRMTIIM